MVRVDSLENVAGFVISLRYLYGCVIYLNGVEVFRNGRLVARSSSGVVLNALAKEYPEIVGGSADLTPSNNTALKCSFDFTAVSLSLCC